MNKYYLVIGEIEGKTEALYSSFVKADCIYEIGAERESWKEEGYKKIKVTSINTTDIPDPEVYRADMCTRHQLFIDQAPSFNFELNEVELLDQALESGYVTKIDGLKDLYLINKDY